VSSSCIPRCNLVRFFFFRQAPLGVDSGRRSWGLQQLQIGHLSSQLLVSATISHSHFRQSSLLTALWETWEHSYVTLLSRLNMHLFLSFKMLGALVVPLGHLRWLRLVVWSVDINWLIDWLIIVRMTMCWRRRGSRESLDDSFLPAKQRMHDDWNTTVHRGPITRRSTKILQLLPLHGGPSVASKDFCV